MSFSLFPKSPKFFELFREQNRIIVNAATVLHHIAEEFADCEEQCQVINLLEAEGDVINRRIALELSTTFITPIDREDIHEINSSQEAIENLRSYRNGTRARVAATVVGEDCERETHEVYFEMEESLSGTFSCNPDAFLLACAIPSMHYGEQRIGIDGEVCPELKIGTTTAMKWLRHWFDSDCEPPRIEAGEKPTLVQSGNPKQVGMIWRSLWRKR